MYTIRDTFDEVKDPALTVPESAMFFGSTLERNAFVWQSYATVRGHDCVVDVVRFFDVGGQWIDTRYPSDRIGAERLALNWVNGSNEILEVA